MRWSEELGIDGVAAKDTNWITSMVELGSEDVDNSSAGRWSSQWSHLRKAWWVEEDEFETFGEILIVNSK